MANEISDAIKAMARKKEAPDVALRAICKLTPEQAGAIRGLTKEELDSLELWLIDAGGEPASLRNMRGTVRSELDREKAAERARRGG